MIAPITSRNSEKSFPTPARDFLIRRRLYTAYIAETQDASSVHTSSVLVLCTYSYKAVFLLFCSDEGWSTHRTTQTNHRHEYVARRRYDASFIPHGRWHLGTHVLDKKTFADLQQYPTPIVLQCGKTSYTQAESATNSLRPANDKRYIVPSVGRVSLSPSEKLRLS